MFAYRSRGGSLKASSRVVSAAGNFQRSSCRTDWTTAFPVTVWDQLEVASWQGERDGGDEDDPALRGFLERIERQYGKAQRVWLMDRGIPTEEVLAEMRACDPPVQYLVGTPKGRLTRLEKALLAMRWQEARPGVEVKLLPQDGELYVFAQSRDRVAKERAIRRRQLRWLWKRLAEIAAMKVTREELLMKLGGARANAPAAWRLIDVVVATDSATFSFSLNRKKLRRARRREGRYLLRTNLTDADPARLWSYYLRLVPWRRLSKISKVISPSARSSIKGRHASKHTSSLPSWRIACTSRSDGACTLSRPASLRAV
jgi:hypothetical protein